MTKFAGDFKRVSDSQTENPDIVLAQSSQSNNPTGTPPIDAPIATTPQPSASSAAPQFEADGSPINVLPGDAPANTAAAPADGAPAPVPGDAPAGEAR